MVPQLMGSANGGWRGNVNDWNWSMTWPELGPYRLLVMGSMGDERSGEQNPEETNGMYFLNGAQYWCTRAVSGNADNFGSSLWYYNNSLYLPSSGTYTVGVNYADNPKTAESHWACSAIFNNVKAAAPEVTAVNSTRNNVNHSCAITTLSANSLIVAHLAYSNGWSAPTWTNATQITGGQSNTWSGNYLAYTIKESPGPITIYATVTDPGFISLELAAFALQPLKPGQIL